MLAMASVDRPHTDMNPAFVHCSNCRHRFPETALFCPNCGTAKVRDLGGDALLGKVIGERFLVHERIGHGTSGTIYRAEHVTLRRRVAIKVLHHELSRDDLAVERFRREATSVGEIDNEHIVEIHDFGRTPDGRLYLAMELLDGETLDVVLARDHQLSVERATDVLIQAGEALMEAHAIGYVHRDIRPRNLFLTTRRTKANFVKLLDFGLAKLVETDSHAASTSLGMTFGDPRYMSPEQARGDRIDRRADIYQLGCIAYEMLTGSPPFVGTKVFDVLSKHVSAVPVPLPQRRPGIPMWLEAAVARMLAKKPDDRFATTSRMVEALRRGLETGEVMETDVARRRETVPPPSVSRVMHRMGLSSPIDPADTPPPATARVPTPRVMTAPQAAVPAPTPVPATKETALGRHVSGAHPVQPAPATEPSGPTNARETVQGRPVDSALLAAKAAHDAATVKPAVVVNDDVTPVAEQLPYVPPRPRVPTPAPVVAAPAPAPVLAAAEAAPAVAPAAPTAGAYDVRATAVPRPFVPAPPVLPATAAEPATSEDAPAPRRRSPSHGHGPSTSSAAGRRLRSSDAKLNESGVSGAWFADGDRDDGETLDESKVRKLDRARRFRDAAATTGALVYDDPGARKKKIIIGGVIGAGLLAGVVAFAMSRGDDRPAAPPPVAPAPLATTTPDTITPVAPTPDNVVVPTNPTTGTPTAPTTTGTPTAPTTTGTPTTSGKTPGKIPNGGRRTGGSSSAGSIPAITTDLGSGGSDDLLGRKPGSSGTTGTTTGSSNVGSSTGSSNVGSNTGSSNTGSSGSTDDPSGNGTIDPYGAGGSGGSSGSSGSSDGTLDPYGSGGGSSGGSSDDGTVDPYETNGGGSGAGDLAKAGSASLRAGDAPAASASFKKALELDPRNVEAVTGLGEVALQQGLYKDALVQLKKAAKLAPKSARVHTLLGEAYLNSGNSSLAAASFKKALQLDPDSSRARNGFNEASARIPPPQDD
jgi:serine/threonine protein kinase